MKYHLLLAGKNHSAIDDFFSHLSDSFDLLTTSTRYDDIMNHLEFFKTDALVYCMKQERDEEIKTINTIRIKLKEDGILFIILGSKEDCASLSQCISIEADLTLFRPISTNSIANAIEKCLREQERQKLANAVIPEPQPRKHILVVDDDSLMLKLVKEYLHETYDVATAPSGKVALKFLENKRTDLILLDYEMPIMDGPAVLEQLHNNPNTENIPVVFLTGIMERGKIQKALVQKPQGYLLKPIERDALLETIKGIFG